MDVFTSAQRNFSEVRSSPSQTFCLLCAKPSEISSLLHIFNDNKTGTVSVGALLKRYLPFPVSESDSLSHYVCKLCYAHVLRWHRFLTLCIKAQIQLKNVEQKSLKLPDQEKLVQNVPAGECNIGKNILVPEPNSETLTSVEQPDLSSAVKKRKSNYCIARWCNNSNNMGIPFFRVPKDHYRALQWLSAADRMDLADKDVAYLYRCYLCATHFTKEMFVNETGKSLNRNAIPSVFNTPAYAQKIDEAISNSNVYPKALQGVRLKNILPKSVQQTQGVPVQGPHLQESYTHILGVVPELQQNPLQEVLFVRDSAPNHSNIHIISVSPVRNDAPETIQILEVQNPEHIAIEPQQLLNIMTDSERGSSAKDICETTEQNDDIFGVNNRDREINQIESSVSVSQTTLMGFTPDNSNVMMLNLDEKPTNMIEKTAILGCNLEEQHSLALHDLHPEDSSPFSTENPSFVTQAGINFQSKELAKDSSSHCLGNIVGSQDFLLMHSSDHIEEAHDHGFTQDKNLNLCGPIVSEPVPGTTAVFEERCNSMMAEASVRAIECTSPSHGQIIEGLMDLDHFLDSR